MGNGLALLSEFHETALAFPDIVKTALAKNPPLKESIKALRGGDGLLQLAKDLDAGTADVNAIQRGRFYLIAHIGKLIPREKGGRGKTLLPDRKVSPFNKNTLTEYWKVTKFEDKIDPYFDDWQDKEPASLHDFINWMGVGGVVATRHGNKIIDWYTPKKYVELARRAMGGIDLDPATSKFAQRVVKAKTYFTADDDGLAHAWKGRVFLNPPFKQPLGREFTSKLCAEVEAGNVKQAVLLTNDQTDTDWWHQVATLAGAVCFLDGRIGFYNQAGKTSCPTNGQTFFYFGNRVAAFASIFSDIGLCMSVYK